MSQELIESLYKKAEEALENEQLDDAKKQIQELLYWAPKEAKTWKLEAKYRIATEAWEAAEFAIEQACQLAETACWPLFLQVEYSIMAASFEDAIQTLHKAKTIASTKEEETEIAQLYAQTVLRWAEEEAQTYTDWTMEANPHFMEEFDAAIQAIEQVLVSQQANKETAVLRAKLAELEGLTEEALEAWKHAYSMAPDDLEVLYGLARTFESIEENEKAHELYKKLFAQELRLYATAGTDSLFFSPEEFACAAEEAWQACVEEWGLNEQPFQFRFHTEDYPHTTMMEESSPDDLFDPRVGLHVAFAAIFSDTPTIEMIMYQRNIERDLEGDDPTSLTLAIQDLLEKYIDRIFDVLGDEEDDWE